MKKNLADDRVIKLETMPGWDNISVTTKFVNSNALITNKIIPTMTNGILTLSIPKSGHGKIELYDAHGKLAATIASGHIVAGSYSHDLSRLSKGMYFLKAKVAAASLSKVITVP